MERCCIFREDLELTVFWTMNPENNIVTLTELFENGPVIDVKRFSNKWLVDYPRIYSNPDSESVSQVQKLVEPKELADSIIGNKLLLRKRTLERWNNTAQRSLSKERRSNIRVLSSAGGLGKSVELYLFSIFGLHLGWVVQYFGRTSVLCKLFPDEGAMAKLYLSMIKYLNKETLENMHWSYPKEKYVEGINIKGMSIMQLVELGIAKESMTLATVVRSSLEVIPSPNLLIMDEHNELFREVTREYSAMVRKIPLHELCHFLLYYTDILNLPRNPCGVFLAGSRHHTFEDNLPSGTESCLVYVQPLDDNEFKEFEKEAEYPISLRQHREAVMAYTGNIPRQIAAMIRLTTEHPDYSFESLIGLYATNFSDSVRRKHHQYIESLEGNDRERLFQTLSLLLFPNQRRDKTILETSYRDKGLIIVLEDTSLRYYNLIARNIILETWLRNTGNELGNMIKEYKQWEGTVKGSLYEKLFLYISSTSSRPLRAWCPGYLGEYLFALKSKDLRYFNGSLIDPAVDFMTDEIWLYCPSNFSRWDFIYYKVLPPEEWSLWFFQLSISSFSVHNVGSSSIERDFEGDCRIAQLINAIRGVDNDSSGYNVQLQVEHVATTDRISSKRKQVSSEKWQVKVKDPNGIDCSSRIRFIYVSPHKAPQRLDGKLAFLYFIEWSPERLQQS